MDSFMQPWLRYATGTLDILEPETRRAHMLQDDAGFVDQFLVSFGRAHTTAIPLVERTPEFVTFFGARDGAVLLPIMLADIDGTPVPSRARKDLRAFKNPGDERLQARRDAGLLRAGCRRRSGSDITSAQDVPQMGCHRAGFLRPAHAALRRAAAAGIRMIPRDVAAPRALQVPPAGHQLREERIGCGHHEPARLHVVEKIIGDGRKIRRAGGLWDGRHTVSQNMDFRQVPIADVVDNLLDRRHDTMR